MTLRGAEIVRALLICVLVCASSLPAYPVAEPINQTAIAFSNRSHTEFSHADFLQTRHVKALDRPLVSSGSIQITAEGFIWAQQTPFQNTLVFNGESVVETTIVGDQAITRPLEDPVTAYITRTLFDMMQSSWAEIQASFHIVEGNSDNESWTRTLIPFDPSIKQLIPRITLSGTRFLEKIDVHQGDETHTLIELSGHRSEE